MRFIYKERDNQVSYKQVIKINQRISLNSGHNTMVITLAFRPAALGSITGIPNFFQRKITFRYCLTGMFWQLQLDQSIKYNCEALDSAAESTYLEGHT